VGCVVLIFICAYILATQARDLTSARKALVETQTELASAQADQLYVQDATYGAMVFLDDTPLAGLCKARPDDLDIQRRCQYQSNYTAVLKAFNEATSSRTAVPRDYRRTLQSYRTFVRFLESEPPSALRSAWLARALEGVAYSQLKLGRSTEAEATIGQALSLDPYSGMVALTALKSACTKRADPTRVREELAAFRRRLDERVTTIANDPRLGEVARHSTRLERQLLEQDDELYFLCGYADVERSRIK
jgi:hypothetical protein